MAQGLKIPLETANGRLKLLTGDDYIQQLVMTALGDGDSENPFQDLGLGEFMIFGINDDLSDGQIREKTIRLFTLLERDQLAKLGDPQTDIFFEEDKGLAGVERKMNVLYINMETQERAELEVPIPPTGS